MRKLFTFLALGLTLTLGTFALQLQPAHAQQALQNQLLGQVDNTGEEVFGQGAENQGNLARLVGQFIRVALSFIGVILLGLFLYAGFLWMTAGGNEDRVKDAKQILQNALIGLVLTMSAFAISSFVLSAINSTGLGNSGADDAASQQTDGE